MNITCEDRERIFLDGTVEEWAALAKHAQDCPACADEVKAWKALSTAAEELRDYRESPALWARIESALRESQARRGGFFRKLAFGSSIPLLWQTALAGALAVLLATAAWYLGTHRRVEEPTAKLLRNSALAEVERTEHEYRCTLGSQGRHRAAESQSVLGEVEPVIEALIRAEGDDHQ